MFSQFKYQRIPLVKIKLDVDNPRLVTVKKLKNEAEIISYLFKHEDFAIFIKKIYSEEMNLGAERPYIIKEKNHFIVIEGNTRIAAYKLLSGIAKAPPEYAGLVPILDVNKRNSFEAIDCSLAPSRDSLLAIMANSHFGLGDKSKWGYLGSRKAVFEEWKKGKSIGHITKVFNRQNNEIENLILEYQMYLLSLGLTWSEDEKSKLLSPAVKFNPPIRFLQSAGHKEKTGINFDKAALTVVFSSKLAKDKFKHLIKRLVISPATGLGATATYEQVFADFNEAASISGKRKPEVSIKGNIVSSTESEKTSKPTRTKNTLFGYSSSDGKNALIAQLLKEANSLNIDKYPAAGTALLRSLCETVLKDIIHRDEGNSDGKLLSLENAIDLCLGNKMNLGADDKKIVKEFKKHHLDYVNLGTHGTVIANADRLRSARDCMDLFIMRNV